MKRILFISHDASRTGSPIILLNLIKWFHACGNFECDLLLCKNGEMKEAFREAADRVYDLQPSLKKNSFIERKLHKLLRYDPKTAYLDRLGKQLAANQYNLIYANSIPSCEGLLWVHQFLKRPSILHVHELEFTIRHSLNPDSFSKAKRIIDRYIAVSELVQMNLINNHNISPERIIKHNEFISKDIIPTRAKNAILEELGIPSNAIVVGGSGTVDWRKGPDVFIRVAQQFFEIKGLEAPVYFVWLGGTRNPVKMDQLLYDIDQLGLCDRILLPGQKTDPYNYFNIFDVFLMTSREDPFPLVCLENGRLGNPVICFDKVVGSTEFISNECGAVVPYLHIEKMVEALVDFVFDEEKRKSAGTILKKRVEDYTIEKIGPEIMKTLNQLQ